MWLACSACAAHRAWARLALAGVARRLLPATLLSSLQKPFLSFPFFKRLGPSFLPPFLLFLSYSFSSSFPLYSFPPSFFPWASLFFSFLSPVLSCTLSCFLAALLFLLTSIFLTHAGLLPSPFPYSSTTAPTETRCIVLATCPQEQRYHFNITTLFSL